MEWTRRNFLQSAAAIASASGLARSAVFGGSSFQDALPRPSSQSRSPEIISGSLRPLLESNVARPLRYAPLNNGFSIHNGTQFFNRPLYGPNIPFRVDGGDLPEFSLYLPGHGGNLRLGIASSLTGRSLWASECANIVTLYKDGRLRYELRDPAFAERLVVIEALTNGAALWIQVLGNSLPSGTELLWAFGGISGRKGRRNGDIGCEDRPVAEFFHLRPGECAGNRWILEQSGSSNLATVQNGNITLQTEWPLGCVLKLADATYWNKGWQPLWASAEEPTTLPLLVGKVLLDSSPLHFGITMLNPVQNPTGRPTPTTVDGDSFSARSSELAAIAGRVRWQTPDPFLDSMAGALCSAVDAIWDDAQGCVMHGAVAWRISLAGWRGPYAMDVTGWHHRMRQHLRHWIARQNHSLITNGSAGQISLSGFTDVVEAHGAPDPGSHDARTENLLHSSGDLSRNHYDMNLVFFDALLRHLRWTGDLTFAREVWPALELHAAWERRLFRRDYSTSGESLPLYEGYAAIWASDNLQYSGGGAAHSSAYNIFLNRGMAELATKLGMEPTVAKTYHVEADSIARAMRELLWIPKRGAFAESREWLADRSLAESPAVWTVYHTIDSEVTNEREAWQMAAERLRALRKVPVRGPGVPPSAGYQIACSDWHPYVWSLTLLVTAENLHTVLALFQSGMADEAYELLRGTLIDAGFRGLCPGNFPMSLQLDPHRQESQRDFADPIGCAARAIVEGLWGVLPDRLNGKLRLRPQLPLSWNKAKFSHPELRISYSQEHERWDRWEIHSAFDEPLQLTLELRSRTIALPLIRLNGNSVEAHFDARAIGEPQLIVPMPEPATSWIIDVEWYGPKANRVTPASIQCTQGQQVPWPRGIQTSQIDDPQGCIRDNVAHTMGGHTVFARQRYSTCEYWLPIELQINARTATTHPNVSAASSFHHVSIDGLLNGHAREVFTRPYHRPRSGLCSLNLPDGLLGGWANFDVQYPIDDSGLRNARGQLPIGVGLSFRTQSAPSAANCRYISHWSGDIPDLIVPVYGRARAVHLLLIGTTFPQATRTAHATIQLAYGNGRRSEVFSLRSPNDWWPVEQNYLVDDYVFQMGRYQHFQPDLTTTWRVDLQTGATRPISSLTHPGSRGGIVQGGAAFVVRVEADPQQELQSLHLHCQLYGVVLGLLGVTVEAA